jgi:exopolysaccharide biosynthesis polyprenyl glycosylphosphotransferase
MTTTPYAYTEPVEEPIRPGRPSFLTRCAQAVTQSALDRAVVTIFPIAAVLLASGHTSHKLLTVAIATVCWFVAVQSCFRHPRLSTVALGTGFVTAIGTIAGLAAVSLLDVWLPGFELSSVQLLLMAAGIFLTLGAVEAWAPGAGSRRRMLFVGADEGIREVLDELKRKPHLPFDVIGFVDDTRTNGAGPARWLGTTGDLAAILRADRPELVVLGPSARRADALSDLLDLTSLEIRVVDLHHFDEHAFGKVPVHRITPEWFMSVLHLYQRPYSRFIKRTFDLLIASIALIVLAPILLAVALLVRATSPGPVLFRQVRLGEGGKVFEMLKFRTMVDGAEKPGVAVWAKPDDARVTRVGQVLRRTRLDELPQFWSVLRGDMSIVGPRPERPEFLELLRETVPFWTSRHLVKPGITGWAQVRRGYTSDTAGTAEKLAYDLYYLKYRSLLLDVAIVWQTARIVLSGSGAR